MATLRPVGAAPRWRTGGIEAPVLRGSATDLLLTSPAGAPIVTVQSAAARIGRSIQATNEAVGRLTAAGILRHTTVGPRVR